MPDPDLARAALYLDFDNVFSILHHQDEALSLAFATTPLRWRDWLCGGPGRRRMLSLRCYMNPGGWVDTRADGPFADMGQHPRVYFSRFRSAFTDAGFEVVDCPRIGRAKNAADVRMVIDVLDAVGGAVPPDEVILATSDSDFLPLLHRLRTLDRRSVLLAHPDLAPAMRATADQVIGLDAFAAGAFGKPQVTAASFDPIPEADGMPIAALRDIVASSGRIHLPLLGKLSAERLGVPLRDSDYYGTGSLEALLSAAGLRRIPGDGGGWVEVAEDA
ncbi:NYN domain-containing protein [Humitalea sp. 24SJ18S-53]|uniref:NYN domain-containing protein n=1 Tax=Humitalea sp. 24SJ18S-53 TaxID=3422307 RepID=UPI003D670ACA